MLKHALSRLPAPRNDYEIVVPDAELQADSSMADDDFIPDQADVEANREAELRAKSECVESSGVFIGGTLAPAISYNMYTWAPYLTLLNTLLIKSVPVYIFIDQ